MIVAEYGVRLHALGPSTLPRVDAIRVDRSAFGFGVAVTTLVGIVVGLIRAFGVIDRTAIGVAIRLAPRISQPSCDSSRAGVAQVASRSCRWSALAC
jgi:hypothetical protein